MEDNEAMSEVMPIRVLIIDDEPLVRGAFRTLLESSAGFEVVAEALDGLEGVEAYRDLLPDIVLMDLNMSPMNGVEATSLICSVHPGACVLALTTFGTRNHIVSALKAGAAGYLLKDSSPQQLLNGIRQALEGNMPRSSTVRRQLVDAVVAEDRTEPAVTMTPRETDLLRQLMRGLTNRQIGRNLHLSEGSVKQYLSHIGTKLGVTSRTQILVKAIQLRLVDPHEGIDA